MIALYFLLSALIALAAAFARQRRTVKRLGAAFYLVQLSLVAHIVAEGYGEVSSQFFRFDAAGTLFFALLTIVSAFVFVHSCVYLRDNPIKEYRLYFTLLMLLTTAITGVYFARNIAVTWIFLEATTLCAAGFCIYGPQALIGIAAALVLFFLLIFYSSEIYVWAMGKITTFVIWAVIFLAGFLIGRFGGRSRSEKAVTKKRLSADDDD